MRVRNLTEVEAWPRDRSQPSVGSLFHFTILYAFARLRRGSGGPSLPGLSASIIPMRAIIVGPPDSATGISAFAALNDVDPLGYLTDVLTRIVNGHPNSDIDQLMPWAYRKQDLRAVA